ncbi:uncharacterized protein LOC127831796 isoform X1 [Dreissena polymorpha]|uniref:RUN domain-containing protein n=1 Tax=Dreissena polymorpha TaxID=45954 RepID=A0A9D4GS84_DREPO|nr:uncharacterized protein LOC127831796 isoform X1 [Dreissena polymorpha]KAH3822399.1 hypothetical protein DPMN_124177 [Dreissena polymorpha]
MFRRKGPSEVEIAKENDVKIAITQEFSKALKTVQKESIGTEDQAVYSTDTANSVCNCLEAVFLHGLKAKAITKIASYVGVGSSATAQTTLNFWNFVAKFTHSEVISQLKHLGQITTEVGLCRAWVRVALNDGIMESYIDAMVADKKTLQYYYNSVAYLRDREQPGIMKTYLQGFMSFQFKLSYNASVLNEWAYTPLVLAGVIDSNDAPPPIIKPAVTNTKRKSVVSIANIPTIDTTETTVEVEQMRSRSRGNSDARAQNPMDQPPFGASSKSSYIVSSSEFTSQDVEEIKKMSSRKSAKAMSECSSSSHLSCPDPPHMNASPATYVKKMYGGPEQSPLSERSFQGLDCEKGADGLEVRINGEARQSEKLEAGVKRISESSAVTVDSSGYGADIETEETVKEEFDVLEKENYEDGESWGQHGQSPVEKPVEDLKRRYQRLESFNRELQEKAIIDSYIEPDAESKKNDETVYGYDRNDGFDGLGETEVEASNDYTIRPMGKALSTKSGEKDQDVLPGNKAANLSVGTDDLLNISQKILNELGLEDSKVSINIEEEVTKSGIQPKETVSTPKKTKKLKEKEDKINKLKPKLSMSPPHPEVVPPVLSYAIADKVERIQTLENPDYLLKHRRSLPAIGVMQRKSDKRKSMPNVMEDVSEEGQASIEEYLYGTAAFDGLESKKDDGVEDDIDSDEDRTLRSRFSAEPRQSIGNNLMLTGRGWSSSFESELGDTVDAMSPPRPSRALPVNRPKSESFGTLLQNYTPSSSLTRHSIDDVLSTLPKRTNTFISPDTSPNEEGAGLEGFEVVINKEDHLQSNEVSKIRLFSEIANEKGLDAQNFQCRGCKRPLGLIFGKQRVCKFDGGYYCFECHENDEYYIPAVIVHNWDFRKHQVAKRNLEFLQDKEEQPYINVNETNPRIYEHVSEMAEIQGLRRQLMYLKMYLFTCKQSIAEDFRRIIWPRDYLYESIELYSLADLLQVPTGGLASSLRKLIRFASKHVYSCRLCSQKGFICELCNNPKVIYAFELDATVRCTVCKTVFHKECKTDNKACPKCQRRLHRQSMQGSTSQILTPDYDLHVT